MKKYGWIAVAALYYQLVPGWAEPVCQTFRGPLTLASADNQPQVVYDYDTDRCPIPDLKNSRDFVDNPVRPFLVGDSNNPTVLWFAGNGKGYFKSTGPKDLSKIQRIMNNGHCTVWLSSRANQFPNQYPIASYYNEIWMVAPFTPDGQRVYALVHNEYHIVPANTRDVYGNLIAASSSDAGGTFQFYQNATGNNQPVIASPYPFTKGKGGMFAQSNIMQWGKYYYILVAQNLANQNPRMSNGVCIYRTDQINDFSTWRGWGGQRYNVPLVPRYPSTLKDPKQYLCQPVLPNLYRFSWSYNTVLHRFIIIGVDTHYKMPNAGATQAFVYTLASLDATSGQLAPLMNASGAVQEYFLKQINWTRTWQQDKSKAGEAYPSLLDPASPILKDPLIPNPTPGDRNYQYSGVNPYLYYTRFNPVDPVVNPQGRNRDVVREQLIVQACQPASL